MKIKTIPYKVIVAPLVAISSYYGFQICLTHI